MKAIVTLSEIASVLKISERAALKRFIKESWPFEEVPGKGRGGKRREYPVATLPDYVQLKLRIHWAEEAMREIRENQSLTCQQPSGPGVMGSLEATKRIVDEERGIGRNGRALVPYVPVDPCSIPEKKATRALLTSRVVSLYHEYLQLRRPYGEKIETIKQSFVELFNAGEEYSELYKELGAISLKSLERWALLMRRSGNDPFALTDRRGRHRKGRFTLTDAQAKIIEEIALVPNQLLDAEIIRVAKRRMSREGVECDRSDDTIRRHLKRMRTQDYARWVFFREGWKALNEKCLFHVSRDYDRIDVGDILFADGHTTNFEIADPRTGKPRRMTLVLWYDMKSNYPLGWDLMPSENTQSILMALYRAVLTLGKLPRVVYLDNGRAFRSKFFAGCNDFRQSSMVGLFERLGIKSIFAWPYHPETKPIEGFFRTFAELERRSLTYTGTDIENKPARMKRNEKLHRKIHELLTRGRAPDVIETHRAIAAWFDEYALRPQQGHLKGRCPLQVFSEGKGPGFTEEERFQLRILMASFPVKRIPRDGIKMPWSESRYYDPELFGRRNQPAVVRYDWQDLSRVYVYDVDGNYICEARPMEKTHPAARHLGTEEDVAELARQVEMKQSLAKQIIGPARTFVESVVVPEVERQLTDGGWGNAAGGNGKQAFGERRPALVEHTMTDEEREQIEREVAEMVALHERERALERANVIDVDFRPVEEAPEAEREPGIWEALRSMPELDRYEKDLEYEAQGMLIPREERDWMGYFERTEQYSRFTDYFEEFRIKMALLYQ